MKVEFSMSLVSELADTQRWRGDVRVSFSKDLNGNILLHVLSIDNTLQIFRADLDASSFVRTNCIEGVVSYTHSLVQLSDTEPFNKIYFPLSLIRYSNDSLLALIGSISLPYHVELRMKHDFAEIQLYSDECELTDDHPGRFLLTSDEKISDRIFVETRGHIRSVRLLPFFLHDKPLVALIAGSADNIPSDATVVILAAFKALEIAGKSEESLLELLLSAFQVEVKFREFCYDVMSSSFMQPTPGRRTHYLEDYFINPMPGDENIAMTIFDLVHLVLCDFILRDPSMSLSAASALGLISAWMYIAWDAAEEAVILDNFDYYNRLSGFSLGHISNYASVATGNRMAASSSLKIKTMPCVIKWIERNISNMHSKQSRGQLALTSYNTSSLKWIECAGRFFRFLHSRFSTCGFIDQEINAIAFVVCNAFNDFLIDCAESENVAKQSIGLALKLKWFPSCLQYLIETSVSVSSTAFDESWIQSLALMMNRDDIIENASLDEESKVFTSSLEGSVDADHDDIDGFHEVDRISSHRFPHDRRIAEVCRMLRSSKSLYLKTSSVGDTDIDPATIKHRQQVKLLSLCRRSLAVVNGRGALTLGTLAPVVAEILPVPPLILKGRCPPNNSEVNEG